MALPTAHNRGYPADTKIGNSTQSLATPFAGLVREFNEQLELIETGEKTRKILRVKAGGHKQCLPGQPRVRLDSGGLSADGKDPLLKYLQDQHKTDKLDSLCPLMSVIFVQTPSYAHITALHHQKSRERKVIVDEHPGLHLLWHYQLIFIKPVPAYFYSQAFWDYIRHADEDAYKASLGFMRSYYYIIQFEIDYIEACELNLIPKKDDGQLPTYEEWCEFIEPFARVGDDHVSRRYHYGEMRLTRINRAAWSRGYLAYFHIYPQWGSFLAHTIAPIITVFAVSSVVLNSMQVSLAAIDTGSGVEGRIAPSGPWLSLLDAALWFPVVVMLAIAVMLVAGILGVLGMGVKDLVRTRTVRMRKKNGDVTAGVRSHGMIW
ncbi:hypothetical protein N656DRAFT_785953 [Canariomyces notabilis]|uniref:Uncharacterized protein n=1 Tax=Canariomyces notabilis TaxID=2074819 RepID=A0AAN6TMV0_9PEZI|nr:hypothetical protein N656DRAFT_785953 [Canariomyces arenarius]